MGGMGGAGMGAGMGGGGGFTYGMASKGGSLFGPPADAGKGGAAKTGGLQFGSVSQFGGIGGGAGGLGGGMGGGGMFGAGGASDDPYANIAIDLTKVKK